MSDDEARLREHFEALRRRNAARAPAFDACLTTRIAPADPRPRLPWLLAATAAGIALLLVARDAHPPPEADLESFGWRTPTDVLLETPGIELLGSPVWEALPEETAKPEQAPQSGIRGRSHA